MSQRASDRTPFGPVLLLAAATLLQIAFSSIQQGVPVLAVFFGQVMRLSLSQMGAMTSALYFGRIVGNTVAGPLVDRVGPRRLHVWGTALVVLFTLFMALLTTYDSILAGLFLLGAALASGPISGGRSIFQMFTEQRRGLAMGIRQAGVPLGGAVAAALIPSLLIGLGFAGVWVTMAVVVAITGTLFTAVAPTFSSGTAPQRLFAPFRDLRGVWIPWLFGFLMAAGQSSTVSFVIVDLHGVHGWPIATASAGLALALLGGGVGRTIAGWLSDHLGGRRPLVLAGIGLLGAGSALLMGWLPQWAPAPLLVAVLFALGFGTLGWNSVTLTWAGERVQAGIAGQAMSGTASCISLGIMLDAPAFGRLVDVTHRYSMAWTAVGLVLTAAALIALWGNKQSVLRGMREGSGPQTIPE